nr:MAG TPA_asm: hypothetical protein [Caudoviricetes sp.]
MNRVCCCRKPWKVKSLTAIKRKSPHRVVTTSRKAEVLSIGTTPDGRGPLAL